MADSDDEIEIISITKPPSLSQQRSSLTPIVESEPVAGPSTSRSVERERRPAPKLNQSDTLIIYSDSDDEEDLYALPRTGNGSGAGWVPFRHDPSDYIGLYLLPELIRRTASNNRTRSAPSPYSSDSDIPDLDEVLKGVAQRKGKGKGKATARTLTQGRSLSTNAIGTSATNVGAIAHKVPSADDDIVIQATAGQKRSLSVVSGSTTSEQPAAKARKIVLSPSEKAEAKAAELALKAAASDEKKQLQRANTLVVGSKEATILELTIHLSGLAFEADFDPNNLPSFGRASTEATTGAQKGKGRGGAKKVSAWLKISEDVQERLERLKSTVEVPEDKRQHAGAEGAVRWTRSCCKKWDDVRKLFVPLLEEGTIIVEEDCRLIFMSATTISHLISTASLLPHVLAIQSRLPSHIQLFLMIYGLPKLYRAMKSHANAIHTKEARERLEEGSGGAAKLKEVGIGQGQPSRETIEMELIKLQVAVNKLFLIQADSEKDAADWIEQLSFDISQKPYVRQRMQNVTDLGLSDTSIVSGKNLEDTFIKMLESIKAVTEPMARSIVQTYPTLFDLMSAYERCNGEAERENLLVGIQKGSNKDWTATHRMIGKSLSKNICNIMCGTEANTFI